MALGTRRLRAAAAGFLAVAALIGVGAAPAHATSGVTEVCRLTDRRLIEISGMTYSLRDPGVLWVHNDSGGGPFIYAIDARTCAVRARVRITGVAARDFEAIAAGRDAKGRPVLWLADIGDNLDSWPYVWLHRIREPSLSQASASATTYRVTYADRPHNAEALLADPTSQRLWIVTKQLAHGRIYALPARLSRTTVNLARPVHREGGLITDGSVSPDGKRYVLRDYVNTTLFQGLPVGTQPQVIPLPFQVQGEAITWTPDGTALLVASERDDRLLRVALTSSAFAAASGSGVATVS
jgi:hypothetical protein